LVKDKGIGGRGVGGSAITKARGIRFRITPSGSRIRKQAKDERLATSPSSESHGRTEAGGANAQIALTV